MRSFWKGPIFVNFTLNKKQNLRIANRKAVIFPSFIGKVFLIKNGNKSLKKVLINTKMVGFKFGSLCITKKVLYKFFFTNLNKTKILILLI